MNFLIVKTSSIGDIIHTFPVVEYLKKNYPGCSVDWIVEEEYASLLKSHPLVSELHIVATRRWRRPWIQMGIQMGIQKNTYKEIAQFFTTLKKKTYDVIFDLQGNTKSALLTRFAKGNTKVGFGWKSCPEWPNYFATEERFDVEDQLPIQQRYLSIVQQYFKDPKPFEIAGVELVMSLEEEQTFERLTRVGEPRIMVAFASKWENKCLSVEQLIRFLEPYKKPFYFVCGTGAERKKADLLVDRFPGSKVLQAISFPLWQRVMGVMELVITVDSAALALCGTTLAPSISFFGPTQASVYKPLGKQHKHFQGSCPYNVHFSARCPRLRTCKTGACIKDLKL